MRKQNKGILRQVCSKEDLADIIGVSDEQLISELVKESRQFIRKHKLARMPKGTRTASADEIFSTTEKSGKRKKTPQKTEKARARTKANSLAPSRHAVSTRLSDLGANLLC